MESGGVAQVARDATLADSRLMPRWCAWRFGRSTMWDRPAAGGALVRRDPAQRLRPRIISAVVDERLSPFWTRPAASATG